MTVLNKKINKDTQAYNTKKWAVHCHKMVNLQSQQVHPHRYNTATGTLYCRRVISPWQPEKEMTIYSRMFIFHMHLMFIHSVASHLFKQGCVHNTPNTRQSVELLAVLCARSTQLTIFTLKLPFVCLTNVCVQRFISPTCCSIQCYQM